MTTILEVFNLMTVGIARYNINQHVPSYIPVGSNGYIQASNLKTHDYIRNISEWT